MTVCIAAISQEGIVFGAADRMLTSGDIEFEPKTWGGEHNQKIFAVTSSIVAMTAGDMGLQSEIIIHHVAPEVAKRIAAAPDKWMSVESVVDLYITGYNVIRRNRAEAQILTPLGLTYRSFADQSKFSQSFLENITKRLIDFSLPDSVETIIAGVEPSQNHGMTQTRLFAIRENNPTCCDAIRFAAIGSGARHAESHLMHAGHGIKTPAPQTLLSTYIAKKRAEIAPGVGKETNIFLIGTALGMFDWVAPELVVELEKIYRKYDTQQGNSLKKAQDSARDAMNRLIASRTANAQKTVAGTDATIGSPPALSTDPKPPAF